MNTCQADELLRELVSCYSDESSPHVTMAAWHARWTRAWVAARAYLNENPPPPFNPGWPHAAASPPHAASEPEKPVAWMYKCWGETIADRHRWADPGKWTETPLYASPAQPIARDEQDAERYRWLREFWIWADNVDAEGHPIERVAISGARTHGLDDIIDSARLAEKDKGG